MINQYNIAIGDRRKTAGPVMGKWYDVWMESEKSRKRVGKFRYMGADMWSDGINGAKIGLPEHDYLTLA